MTTEKNPYESDDERETQALPPVDPTVELPATSEELGGDEHVEDTGAEHGDGLADEIFRGEPTQVLPVADPTLALPVAPPTQVLPTQALPTPASSVGEPAATHTQAYPVQDAPVDPEPDPVPVPSPAAPAAPAPGPAPAVDPAAQWNTTAQQRAQGPTGPAQADDPRDRGLRVGTVVWGFVIVAVGAGILALALGATYDLDLALIALLSVAGLVLVVGSIVSSTRRSARERARR